MIGFLFLHKWLYFLKFKIAIFEEKRLPMLRSEPGIFYFRLFSHSITLPPSHSGSPSPFFLPFRGENIFRKISVFRQGASPARLTGLRHDAGAEEEVEPDVLVAGNVGRALLHHEGQKHFLPGAASLKTTLFRNFQSPT
jgi:hypothetical protein